MELTDKEWARLYEDFDVVKCQETMQKLGHVWAHWNSNDPYEEVPDVQRIKRTISELVKLLDPSNSQLMSGGLLVLNQGSYVAVYYSPVYGSSHDYLRMIPQLADEVIPGCRKLAID